MNPITPTPTKTTKPLSAGTRATGRAITRALSFAVLFLLFSCAKAEPPERHVPPPPPPPPPSVENDPKSTTATPPVVTEPTVVRVNYVTDRKATSSTNPEEKFGDQRGNLSFGYCDVSIPPRHQIGQVERPRWWRLEFTPDPAKHVTLVTTQPGSKSDFFQAINDSKYQESAFIFTHGYNVTFADAALRTAQISFDLSFAGASIFYSWPAVGKTASYTRDEQSIEWSQANLTMFLEEFFSKSKAKKVYVIAHSMGNRAMTRSLASLIAKTPEAAERLTAIILAAPDIDADVFKRDIAPALVQSKRPLTLYASSRDRALVASRLVHGAPRAGDAERGLTILAGIETIDATLVGTDFLGHSYVANSATILSDMHTLFHEGTPADKRFGLESRQAEAGRYFRFKPR